jgi:hypothetical protein
MTIQIGSASTQKIRGKKDEKIAAINRYCWCCHQLKRIRTKSK